MAFQITYHAEANIVESCVQGLFDNDLVESMAPELAKKVAETASQRILIDFRQAHIALSTVKIYQLPAKLFAEFSAFGVDIRWIKRAILITTLNNDFDFLRIVTENQGQIFKLFTDRESALSWLMEE